MASFLRQLALSNLAAEFNTHRDPPIPPTSEDPWNATNHWRWTCLQRNIR